MKGNRLLLVGLIFFASMSFVAPALALPSYVGVVNGHIYEYTGSGKDNSSGTLVEFEITVDPRANKNSVVKNIIARLQQFFRNENFQIDQPIRISDVSNIIFNNSGVVSVTELKFKNLVGRIDQRIYSDNSINILTNTLKGLLFPPDGGIFEVKYPNFDIVGAGI